MLDAGDVYSTTFEVRNTAGTLTTPASHALTLTLPDGTTATPTLTVASVGVLRLDYATTQAGRYSGRLVTTGPDSAHTFTFDAAEVTAGGVVSLADAKAHLNITDATHDEELRTFIDAASQWVESRVGAVVRRSRTDTVYANGNALLLPKAPVISVTTVAGTYGYSDTYSTAAGSLYLDADAGIVHLPTGQSWSTSPLTVTYVAGRAVVPAAIRLAALMYLKALWETQRGSTPIQGFNEEVEDRDGMGLAVWRAEKLLEPYLMPRASA